MSSNLLVEQAITVDHPRQVIVSELSVGGRPLSSWPIESSPEHWLIGAM
jgi:hypothetical protein